MPARRLAAIGRIARRGGPVPHRGEPEHRSRAELSRGRSRRIGRLIACLVVLAALSGCESFGRVGPPPQQALLSPPSHPILVEPKSSPDFRERYVTALDVLRVKSAQRQLVLWHSLPRTLDWATVAPDVDGVARIPLTAEGVHLIGAAPIGVPPLAASVEVIVDRTAPRAKLRFERLAGSSMEGTHFRMRWRAEDPFLALKSSRLDWRMPSGTWQTLSAELPGTGSITFPWPEAEARNSTLRFTARDIAGNETVVEVPLAEAFDRREWVSGGPRDGGDGPPLDRDGLSAIDRGEPADARGDAWGQPRSEEPAGDPSAMTGGPPSTDPRTPIHEPVFHEPVFHEPVFHEPVFHEPVFHEPVIQEPVIHEPIEILSAEGAGTPASRTGATEGSTTAAGPGSTGRLDGVARRETTAREEASGGDEIAGGTEPASTNRGGSIRWPVRAGEVLAAGSEIPAPIRGVVTLVDGDGTVVDLVRRGNRLQLPTVDGDAFALAARGETSPRFAIDGRAPEVTVRSLDADPHGVRISWSLADPEEPGGVVVTATVTGEGAPETPIPLEASPVFIPLPLGDHAIAITARDARGHETRMEPMPFTVGVTPPRIRDLAGRVIAGGSSRYLLVDHGAAVGPLRLNLLPVDGGAPLDTIVVDAAARMVLWDVPPVDGSFTMEITWTDEAGDPHRRLVEPPFAIDASPPRPDAHLVAARVRDEITVRLDGEEALEVAAVVRRRDDSRPWAPLEEGWRAELLEAGACAVVIDASTWGEGEWGTGVIVRDRFGQLVDEPIETGIVTVDRTPPQIIPLGGGSAVVGVEGVPIGACFSAGEPLEGARLTWVADGVAHPVAAELHGMGEERYAIAVGTLPAGRGRLTVEGEDAAGNRARAEVPVSVERALEGAIVLYPAGRAVPPGDEIFVEVPLSPAATGSGAVEMRLVEEGSGRLRARQSLSDFQRVSFRAPDSSGEYRIEVGPRDGAPFTDGVIRFRVDIDADPRRVQRALVERVRDWETRMRAEGSNASGRAEHAALVADLSRELADDPRAETVRRALARLHYLADPRRVDLAAETLQEGLRLALPAVARAALLNDLAVITIEVDAERARELLTRAVELDPSSLRHRNLADVELRLGHPSAAAERYRAAFELDATASIARDRWARAMALRGRSAETEARTTIETWYRDGRIDEPTAQRLWQQVRGLDGGTP